MKKIGPGTDGSWGKKGGVGVPTRMVIENEFDSSKKNKKLMLSLPRNSYSDESGRTR